MNIRKYMKEHEAAVTARLSIEDDRNMDEFMDRHERMIQHMQHERLIHLMVTLAMGLFLIAILAISMFKPNPLMHILTGLLLILLCFYIAHYYFLENTIQHWYRLMDAMEKKRMNAG